ncbi:MAG: ABC transporter ATP-binding protein [Phycisphaerae bacterium]
MQTVSSGPTEQTTLAPILDIRDLRMRFQVGEHDVLAVDGVSLAVRPGQIVALVGESGCGKSATALSILRLIPSPPGCVDAGEILFRGPQEPQPVSLLKLTERAMTRIRGRRISMIFQNPQASLNPVLSVGAQVAESFTLHQGLRGKAAMARAINMLERVGLDSPARRAGQFPHQLSGGMQQRVMIAMALACDPSLLIADEPTTALDVTIQRQILELLHNVRTETGMSVLLITHDLGIVAQVADYVYVMYAGKIVEHADVRRIFKNPRHRYTLGLLRCMPQKRTRRTRLLEMPETIPRPTAPPRPIPGHEHHFVAPATDP